MKTAEENEVARIGHAVEIHEQELDDCLTVMEELRNDYFDSWELSTDCAGAMFRLIQSTLKRFVDDLDTARGIPSPETSTEQSK